jgi:hypothetical protein
LLSATWVGLWILSRGGMRMSDYRIVESGENKRKNCVASQTGKAPSCVVHVGS